MNRIRGRWAGPASAQDNSHYRDVSSMDEGFSCLSSPVSQSSVDSFPAFTRRLIQLRCLRTYVDGEATLIGDRLSQWTPALCELIEQYTGCRVIPDRRQCSRPIRRERRHRAAVLLTASLLFASPLALHADDAIHGESEPSFSQDHSAVAASKSLGLLNVQDGFASDEADTPSQATRWQLGDTPLDLMNKLPMQSDLVDPNAVDGASELKRQRSEQAYRILSEHYIATAKAPAYMMDELRSMAQYIGQREAAFELLNAMAEQPWQLRYRQGVHETVVRGTAINIKGVRLYFDPRSAAQLAFHSHCERDIAACTISPVDALLHELLHAYSSLVETKAFIRSGAMASVFYPVAHEREVIDRENVLYRAMTKQDQIARPLRRSHAGRYIPVACATCLQADDDVALSLH
ncbi:hypothetical protein GYB62_01420 [bacterium]|nr:hypothetical protein [bacterium]